ADRRVVSALIVDLRAAARDRRAECNALVHLDAAGKYDGAAVDPAVDLGAAAQDHRSAGGSPHPHRYETPPPDRRAVPRADRRAVRLDQLRTAKGHGRAVRGAGHVLDSGGDLRAEILPAREHDLDAAAEYGGAARGAAR